MLALVAAAAPSAQAQAPVVPPPQPVPPKPKPKPQAGRMSIDVLSGVSTRFARYVSRRQRVLVVGRVRPFVAGQFAVLEVVRRGKVSARYRVPIRPGRRGTGRFVVRFTPRRQGLLRLVARHPATAQQVGFRARSKRVKVVRWSAGLGASGTRVVLLQRTLRSLGYAIPVSGRFEAGTARGVLAFRKVNHMGWSGHASPAVYAKALRRQGRFRLRHPKAGKHVEFDWSRQVVVLADRGRARRVYHASSGKASTPTVFGSFRFYSKTPGTNSHGMVHSNYFIGGYAIHGYPSVPTYPASHGCIRIPIPNALQVFRAISLGEKIFVYR